MVTALFWPESSKIIQKRAEDFEGFGMVRVKSNKHVQVLHARWYKGINVIASIVLNF